MLLAAGNQRNEISLLINADNQQYNVSLYLPIQQKTLIASKSQKLSRLKSFVLGG